MGRMLGAFDDSAENDRPDLNKCPDCGCFFASDNCTICGKPCPEEMKAGNRKPVRKKKRRSDSRVVFVDWYHNWWVILIALIIFPYIGIVLLLTSPHKKSLKLGIAAVAVVYTLLTTYGVGRNIGGYLTNMLDKPVNTSVSKEEYVSMCEPTDAEKFYRMAESYEDEYISVELVVNKKITDSDAYYQKKKYPEYFVCSDASGEFTILVRDCIIDGVSNFLAGETITVYGEAEGNISVYDMQYELYSAPCLNAAYIELCEKENTVPVTVEFAEESTLYGADCHEFIIDDSEYMSRLVFRANETIKNVSFNSLRYEGSNYFVDEQLYTLPELVSQKPLVAGVVFYGDMTTYGLSFTDAVGNIRNFYICISGKDGSLIMAEYNNSEN